MSRIILQSPWRQQPQQVVGVDWSNPSSRGLVFAWESIAPQLDLSVHARMSVIQGGLSRAVTPYGVGLDYSGSQSTPAVYRPFSGLDNAVGATYEILLRFDSANPTAKFFSQWDATNRRFTLEASGGTLIWVAGDKTGGGEARSRFDLSGAFPSAGWYHIVAAFRGGADYTLLINGVDKNATVQSSGCQSFDPSTEDIQVGGQAGQPLSGGVVFARVWRRGMPRSEAIARAARPDWQIFVPIRRRLWVPSGSGATLPTLSAVTATNVTSTGFQPRVTATY